jgi:diguanylate cyclase (GGDEF)-like protein
LGVLAGSDMSLFRLILCALMMLVLAEGRATAASLRIGNPLCYAMTDRSVADTATPAAYRCTGAPKGYQSGSLWLRASIAPAITDQDGVVLLIHQTRFDRLAVTFTYADGKISRQIVERGAFGDHWRLGGQIAFSGGERDAPVTAVLMRFDHLASHKLLRIRVLSVTAASQNISLAALLIGGALMLLLLGAVYSLALAIAMERQFLAWHALWAGCVLIWGLIWSQAELAVAPGLAGTLASQLCTFLSCAAITAATISAVTAFGAVVPRWLNGVVLLLGTAVGVLGIPASIVTDSSVDQLGAALGILTLADLAGVALCMAIAWRRHSVEARDLAGAWAVPMATLALTMVVDIGGRLFGGGSQIIVLFACAFQTVWVATATTRRLSNLRSERDAARAAESAQGELARRDPLTSLLNRRGFVEAMNDICPSRDGVDYRVGLMLIDVDHFKSINDVFGHEVGDAVLCRLADCLRAWEGPRRRAGRLGGEEFLLGAIDLSAHELEQLADRVRIALAACDHGAVTVQRAVTVSIGVASGGNGATFETLYGLADRALYEAKRAGRNRVVYHGGAAAVPSPDQESFAWTR